MLKKSPNAVLSLLSATRSYRNNIHRIVCAPPVRSLTWDQSYCTLYSGSMERVRLPLQLQQPSIRSKPKSLGSALFLLVCDIDDTLTGDVQAISDLNES